MKKQPQVRLTSAKLIAGARRKTTQVQQELAVAEAELHMANAVLVRSLPEKIQQDDVLALALVQSAAVEERVHEAVEELAAVTELLKDEEAGRARLELELARKSHGSSGEGSDSALAQLLWQEQKARRN